MALQKITEAQRELMKQKSAQSLPDVPSSKGWTPKQFKNAITRPLFDNENSFYSYINGIVDIIEITKADISFLEGNYYNKNYIDDLNVNTIDYINEQISTSESYMIQLINLKANDSEVVHITGNEQISGQKVFNGDLIIPFPANNYSAVNKEWVFTNYDTKTITDQKIKTAQTQAEESAKEYSKTYTDQAINKLIDGAPDALNTFKEIADYIASDKTGASQMTASINKNKQDIATNTNQINALEQNKLDKEDLIYENVENAPQEVVLIIRDVASPSTVNVAREIQFGNDVWKIGSNSGSGGSSIDEEILSNYVKKEELSTINGTSLLQSNDLNTNDIGINSISSLELEAILK